MLFEAACPAFDRCRAKGSGAELEPLRAERRRPLGEDMAMVVGGKRRGYPTGP